MLGCDSMQNNKFDTSSIPKCNIMKVNIAAINMEVLINFVENNLSKLKNEYICVANVHTTVMAFEDDYYKEVQNSAVLAIPDGGPLASVGRKRGYFNMQRVTGPDFMNEILKISEEKGYKHYFYGSTKETLNKLKENLLKNYPKLQIVGLYSPPFRELTKEEDQEIINNINKSNADFIWVALGAPKQEIWMYNHKDKVNGLMVGVGAAFDFVAGNIKRAPKWMQKLNLEWFYRLLQEPKRLFKRYWHTNSRFIYHAMIRGR